MHIERSQAAAQDAVSPRLVRVAVAGATGYVGRELIAILARHPKARLVKLASSGRTAPAPFDIEKSHPALAGRPLPRCQPLDAEDLSPAELDLVFLATPHEVSHEFAPALLERGLRLVDLSGAFRLKDARAYPRWYGFEHQAGPALAEAAYGCPELNATAIRRARLVSNPGCYATSMILALAPLLQAGWVDVRAGIICDAKSGASGAGRTLSESLLFSEVNENCHAYGLFNHRHVPETLQALGLDEKDFVLTPHLLPITRGILTTVYVRLKGGLRRRKEEIGNLFCGFYASSRLVRIRESGTLPEIQTVTHTNYADLGFVLDEGTGRLVLVSCLDNLGKGAAGQAVQNMNLMFGFPEETGLV